MEVMLPLNAIRVFATVGRLLSVKRAADELHVTASAVSHQLKSLETYLGVSLLQRDGNRISLTREGRAYLQQISEGLLTLSSATNALKTVKERRVLTISAPPGLLRLWVIPRLSRFTEKYPEIPLALISTRTLADFGSGQCDIAIRYCKEIQPGLRGDRLCSSEVFPICSPALIKCALPLQKITDLRHHTLLDCMSDGYLDGGYAHWGGWLQFAKVPDLTGASYLSISSRNLMYASVFAGLGVGLGRTLAVADYLASGKLLCPFGPVVPVIPSYCLVCPEVKLKQTSVSIFRDWLIAEARTSRRQLDEEPFAKLGFSPSSPA